MTSQIVTKGKVAFSNLEQHEMYKGQSTGRYSLVITMEEVEASKLEDMGVKMRTYEGTKQRKFASKFKVDALDLENEPVQGDIPYGSDVRVLWAAGDAHPEHGVPTYLNKIRVVAFAEVDDGDTPEEF
jgi:hypothetical protein